MPSSSIKLAVVPAAFGLAVAILISTSSAVAQEASPAQQAQNPDDFFTERQECFDGYHYGSVGFAFNENYNDHTYPAGSEVTIEGTLTNDNEYPLTKGVVFARLLRQDDAVAQANWHPIVSEQDLPGSYDLPAKGTLPFTFKWTVPKQAPAGVYRLELSYVADSRTIAGIPYAAGMPAGSTIFQVTNTTEPFRYASFDLNTIKINDQSFQLRTVPPTLSADQPVKVTVNLEAKSPDAIPITLHSALYAWSNSDKESPVWERTSQLTIKPSEPLNALMDWDKPAPGAYELVMIATPDDETILSSVVKVRFPVEGNMPRIIYSGIGGYDNQGNAIITTCAVNGTFDKEGSTAGGSLTTVITTNGKVLGQTTVNTTPDRITASTVKVPLAKVAQAMTVATLAKNDQGVQSDSNATQYAKSLLATTTSGAWVRNIMILVGVLLLVAFVVIVMMMLRKRRTPDAGPKAPTPPTPITTTPKSPVI